MVFCGENATFLLAQLPSIIFMNDSQGVISMPIYNVTFSIMGTGTIEVDAKNKAEAENKLLNMTTEQLIEFVDFSDGLNIEEVEKS